MERRVSGTTAVLAFIAAGLIIGGPLIGLMGITFAATMTLLLLTSPLFIIFSPVLLGAVCVLALVMVGFAAAGAMAVVGVASMVWIFRSFTGGDKLMESAGSDWAGYIQQKPHENMLINV